MRAFAKAPSAGSSTRGNGNPFSFGFLAAMLVCAAALLGIGAPAASAAPEAELGWAYQKSFGAGNSDVFKRAFSAVIVDSHGNVFVPFQISGSANGYAADGTSLGKYVFDNEVGNIAIDSGDDTVYVDSMFGGPITRFTSNGEPVPTYTQDPGFSLSPGASFAVDETTHDILVTEPGSEAVLRYDTTGALLDTISTPSMSPTWIATAADGSFYVAPEGGSDLTHLSATGTVLGTIGVGGALQGLTFDHTDELLVASVDGTLKTYTPAGTFLAEGPGGNAAGLGAADSRLYELANGVINAYAFATIPGVEAPVVSNVQATSAHVEAEVDPGAGPPEGSVARFEYSSNGGESWTSTPEQSLSGLETIQVDLEGLALNSDFLVRVKASNSLASKTSAATPFSTPEVAPVVITGAASDRSETSAVLNGKVNPAGLQTSYHFEYGTTTAYGSRVPDASEAPAGDQRAPRSVSKYISGLQPGTTYHYRLVAENAIGESPGEDLTFTTLAASEAAPVRGYEQVTPVDKEGAQVFSNQVFWTADDGSAVVVATGQASQDTESAPMFQANMVRRGSSDWLPWQPIDPPVSGASGWIANTTLAISDDGEHALVDSNKVLAPGGIAGGGNIYVEDLTTGTFRFVAGAPGEGSFTIMTIFNIWASIRLEAAPDFSWIVFVGQPPFLPEATAPAVYRWSEEDGLSIVSRVEGDLVPPIPVQSVQPTQVKFPTVSTDGSVVAFGYGFGVYRRENGVSTPISVSHVPGDTTEPQPGYLDWMTPDGRYVFFHSPSKLTEDGEAGSALYRYDAQTGDLVYLTQARADVPTDVLGASDDGQTVYFDNSNGTSVWREGQIHSVTPATPYFSADDTGYQVNISSDGRYFAYLNLGDAYLYDAQADANVCVSCMPDGGPGGGAHLMWRARTLSDIRMLTDDGTMFFDTPRRLATADHNGTRDVYEYKDGRLTLISPGDENFDALLIGISKDGGDVFFQTDQGIVSQDVGNSTDIYDARVGGGFASQNPDPPPAPCSGANCGPVSAGSAESGPSLGSTPNAPASARITLGKVSAGAKAVKVKFEVNQAGTVKVSGSGVKTATRKVAGPGTYTVTAPLTKKARKQLGAGKQVKVSLAVLFSGDSSSASANYSRTLG